MKRKSDRAPTPARKKQQVRKDDGSKAAKVAEADEDMFQSYARLDIHKVMIKDFPRTDAYRRAIVAGRAAHFEGKAVLDVGCGLGILSMLAARHGGARVVYAVEACAQTAARAERIVADNGLSDRIRVFHGVMEKVKLPEKVDVVISEWMGYFLVHESMLESVLAARDRWLRPGGLMYPSRAQLFLCPGNFQKQLDEGAGFWREDPFGFDFRSLCEGAEVEVRAQPLSSETLTADQLLPVPPVTVADFDLAVCTKAMVRKIRADFSFVLPEEEKQARMVHGMALWFDVTFPAPSGRRLKGVAKAAAAEGSELPVTLRTGPHHPLTHWGQTLTLLDEPFALEPGEEIPGTMKLSANKDNHRFYDLSFA